MYDITQKLSFKNLSHWLAEIKEHGDENIVVMLVGNKSDLHHLRAVQFGEAKHFAEERNMLFIEASAVEEVNVDAAFNGLVQEITRSVLPRLLNNAPRHSVGPSSLPNISSSSYVSSRNLMNARSHSMASNRSNLIGGDERKSKCCN